MIAAAGEVGGDPPELYRCPEECPPEGASVRVIVERASTGDAAETEGAEPFSGHCQVAGQNVPYPDLTILRDPALKDHPKAVAGLNVTGEVHLPGVYVGQIPGQPLAVAAVELLVGDAGIQCFIE
jgi:hypothetical protein